MVAGRDTTAPMNFGRLIHTVQHNCHVSDARFAGNYSMCIFLLKMREFYRWEHELPLSRPLTNKEVGDWLARRESCWESLEQDDYQALPLEAGAVNPFEVQTINRELLPAGFLYSGGEGLFHKPHFLLGRLASHCIHDGIHVYVSACEYARDLSMPPAMALGEHIFVSREGVRRFLWERLEEHDWRPRPGSAIARAIACYGGDQDGPEDLLDRMIDREMHAVILHEIGEVLAGRLLGSVWNDMLAQLPRSRAEITARAIRDNLADCLSTLPELLDAGDEAALHFYFANFNGLRRELFPELRQAYQSWLDGGSFSALRAQLRYGQAHWHALAGEILSNHGRRPDQTVKTLCALVPA